eukprot:Seg1447.2 transcript_id=Seg1447.2/GoldUCD/mRNA.D3Y31 product="DNA replication licensing factor MCM3" protein_id=Seg1447.2/GoldUCD/D3Y31
MDQESWNEIRKCGSLIRPKVVRSVHYCPNTKKTMERRYTDMTSLNAYPTTSAYPTKDDDGNPLETEYGLSIYKDHQTFTIQVRGTLLRRFVVPSSIVLGSVVL